MKKYFIIGLIAIPCSLMITSLCIADGLPSQDTLKFPIQPNIVYNASRVSFINPFEMTSCSIGKFYARYHHDISKTFQEKKWFDSLRSHNYEIKIEVPFYKKNTSLGVDCAIFFDEKYVSFDRERVKKPDFDSRFVTVSAIDWLATLKFKLPFCTNLGHFALTMTPKAGLVYIPMGYGYQSPSFYRNHLGFVVGAAVGIDYYFSQWLGVFVEYCAKYNNIQFLEEKNSPQQKYAYSTTTLTFGIKTTF